MQRIFSRLTLTDPIERGASSGLGLLPLSIALIAFSTGIPIEIRSPVWPSMGWKPLDFASNVLLYLPLGLALCRSSLLRVLSIGVAISTAIELSQLWSFGRFASAFDVVANSLGAVAGVLVARRIARTWNVMPTAIPVSAALAGFACIVAVMLAALSAIPAAPSDLRTWDRSFTLLLGNETSGDRPWAGRISALALIPEALTGAAARSAMASFEDPEKRAAWVPRDGYLLNQPIELKSGDSVQLPTDVATHFASIAMANHAFAVVARVTPANVEQAGPARVVSYSRGTLNRNFDLGQEGRRLTFRIRTRNTGPNGNDPWTQTPPLLGPGQDATVLATFDGKVARIFLDGAMRARDNLWASGCLVPAVCDSDLVLERGVLGACAAIVALWLARASRRRHSVFAALAAGVAATVLIYLLDKHSGALEIAPLGPLFALTGAATVALSVRSRESRGRSTA